MDTLRRRHRLALVVVLAILSSPGCLVRRRVVAAPGKHENRPLLTATKDELIQRIHTFSDPIQSLTMKVDMSPSVGSLYGGQVTDYPALTGFILFLRPDNIRVMGLDPVIHGTAFDMVSSGDTFHVSIPSKNEFIIGQNSAPPLPGNTKLENLRPVTFLHSLLVAPPDPQTDYTVLEDDTNEARSVYILMIMQRDGDQFVLRRDVFFDHYTLQITGQKTFDNTGKIRGYATYAAWKSYSGISFPSAIDIQRPQDGYEVVLTVIDMKINADHVTPDKFNLTPPPNAQIKELK